jgi:hypothetical protein
MTYKLTQESSFKRKRVMRTTIAINYSIGFIIIYYALVTGYSSFSILLKVCLAICFLIVFAFGYFYFTKKNAQKIDALALTITDHNITVSDVEQQLSLNEIVKVEEIKHGIVLTSKYDFKKTLFVNEGFENFDSIKTMLIGRAHENLSEEEIEAQL